MAVGGNQRARSFFKQHGWDDIGSDKIESKYTSRAAQLYRKQLEKDVAKAVTQGAGASSSALGADGPTAKPAASAKAVVAANGTSSNPTATVSRPLSSSTTAGAKARLATRRAGAPKTTGGGLGIKKISKQIDDSLFDQAPVEDEPEQPTPVEDAETLEEAVGGGGTASRFTMDALEEKRRPPVQRGRDGHLTLNPSTDFFADPLGSNTSVSSPRSPTGVSRAHGGSPSGYGTAATTTASRGGGGRGYGGGKATAAPAAEPDSGVAQARFGNAKSISSSAFFNDEQKESDYERQGKLAQFQGSAAISSDAYFGRQSSASRGSNVDASAADLVSKISLTARQDVQQLKAMASEAGGKLSRMAQSFVRDLQGGF